MTMHTRHFTSLFLIALAACVPLAGCEERPPANAVSAPPATTSAPPHPTEGPHHGSLIELGNEEYHAELVHDEPSGAITIYILDSAATEAVPIEAAEVAINITRDEQPEQYTLAASPAANDPPETSSQFASSQTELAAALDHPATNAQLVATIRGKQYRGAISHHQDHEGHEHEHE